MRKAALAIGLVAATMAGAQVVPTEAEIDEAKRRNDERREGRKPETTIPKDIPDRVSLEEDSPHFFPHWRRIGVRINGGDSTCVVEFCVSEGWARTQVFHGGRPKVERGRFLTVKRNGTIEPYWRS